MLRRFKKVCKKKTQKRMNNKGVTLVELIIAVAILGIVVTPLLHAFITSARLNSKARNKLEQTALAENLMEEFNDASIEDMTIKYSGTEFLDGKIQFLKIDHGQLSSEIASDVYVDVFLDPTIYATENNENLVDLETISASDCAIYSMPLGYDEDVYKIFEDNSSSANATNPGIYTYKDKDFFRENLERIIFISLIKTGESSEGIDLVRVEMNMEYAYLGAGTYLEAENIRYTTKVKELFDNSKTEIPLNSIYLMYLPRFDAAKIGHYDDIRIFNDSNVTVKAFVVRQGTTEDTDKLPEYKTRKSGHIMIIENNPNIPYTLNTTSALQLRTNMHADLLDTHSELTPAELNCKVLYRNQTGTGIASEEMSKTILNVSTLDGRTLDNTVSRNRIYEMKIELYREEIVAGVLEKTMLSTMSGTKIE